MSYTLRSQSYVVLDTAADLQALQHVAGTPLTPSTRPRKVHQRNWESAKIVALIAAKAAEHAALLGMVDPRMKMESATMKWFRIVIQVIQTCISL